MRTILQPFSVICCSSVVHEADVSALDRQMDYIMCMCLVLCVCVCRTTWQAPCVTSVRPGSSTYQRPTPRAVCAVSVWASPSSAPAPLGIEIRQVAKLLMVKGGVNIFGIKV